MDFLKETEEYKDLAKAFGSICKANCQALQYVPSEFWSEDLFERAVFANELAIQFVPEEYMTEKIVKWAVERKPTLLRFVPEAFQNDDLCFQAVGRDYEAAEYIKIWDKELAGRIVHWGYPLAYKYIPDEYKSEELSRVAVKGGAHLADVPMHLRTKVVCLAAINQNPYQHPDIPKELLTLDMCLELLAINDVTCRCFPKEVWMQDNFLLAKIALATDNIFSVPGDTIKELFGKSKPWE